MSVTFIYPTANGNPDPLYVWEPLQGSVNQQFVCVGDCGVKWVNSSCTNPVLFLYCPNGTINAPAVFASSSSGDLSAVLTTWDFYGSMDARHPYVLSMFCDRVEGHYGDVSNSTSFYMHINNWDYTNGAVIGPETYSYTSSTARATLYTSASNPTSITTVSATTTVANSTTQYSSSASTLASATSTLTSPTSSSASATSSSAPDNSSSRLLKGTIASIAIGVVGALIALIATLLLWQCKRSKTSDGAGASKSFAFGGRRVRQDRWNVARKSELPATTAAPIVTPELAASAEQPSAVAVVSPGSGFTPLLQQQLSPVEMRFRSYDDMCMPMSAGLQARYISPLEQTASAPTIFESNDQPGSNSINTLKAQERETQRQIEVNESLQRLRAEQAALHERIHLAEMQARE